ncbi:hypothetical protein CYY_001894 [Polysphondylium violaceum]|uniref:Uncharacterized protein n=1 Tax=Polysphondylium violaceum TaxID=133409 RepID=A0A8J4V7G4_9MYCE|nr:hypothetical protein CYY_001894 [Polysphondylium violaceum]
MSLNSSLYPIYYGLFNIVDKEKHAQSSVPIAKRSLGVALLRNQDFLRPQQPKKDSGVDTPTTLTTSYKESIDQLNALIQSGLEFLKMENGSTNKYDINIELLNKSTIDIHSNHQYLGSFVPHTNSFIFDVDFLFSSSDQQQTVSNLNGYTVLYSSLIYYLFKLYTLSKKHSGSNSSSNSNGCGNSNVQREALHAVVSYVLSLGGDAYEDMMSVLRKERDVIDSSHLFTYLVLDTVEINRQYVEVCRLLKIGSGVDTVALEEMVLGGGIKDAQQRELVVQWIAKRDNKISWYLGQSKIDLPYSRSELREALSVDDVKVRRDRCFDVIKKYDRRVELDNATRLSNQIRETWFENNSDVKPVIVVGRESRAFSNQATLFASSNYIGLTDEIKQCIKGIIECLSHDHFVKCFKSIVNPDTDNDDTFKRLLHTISHLYPVVGRFRSNISTGNQDNLSSMTQFHGCIQQLREVLIIVSTKCNAIIQEFQNNSLNIMAEGVQRRVTHQHYQKQNEYCSRLYQFLDTLYGRSFANKSSNVWSFLYQLEQQLYQAPSCPSTFSVLLQRPSVSGSERFKTNELEPKPEQEDALQKLVRIGGENLYMSPSTDWVVHATDIIEAVPLFIYERTLEIDGKVSTIFEVDQDGLEQTIRNLADPWSKNIQLVILSEHIALAREIYINSNQQLLNQYNQLLQTTPNTLDDNIRRKVLIDNTSDQLTQELIQLVLYIEHQYDQLFDQVESNIETNWNQSNFITRIDSLKYLLLKNQSLDTIIKNSREMNSKNDRKQSLIEYYLMMKQRSYPAFHLLTTEAPGLVEGFIQAVLEEEMCLGNLIDYFKLSEKVHLVLKSYQKTLLLMGKKVIQEFNYQPIVEQYCNQMNSADVDRATLAVIGDHVALQRQVSLLCVLFEFEFINNHIKDADQQSTYMLDNEPMVVKKLLENSQIQSQLYLDAVQYVYSQNKNDQEFASANGQIEIESIINSSGTYSQEVKSFIHWEARQLALKQLDKEKPELFIKARFEKYYRNHTSLATTTAKRNVVYDNDLHQYLSDPRFSYSCGVLFSKDGSPSRPTGARKRYHFVYGPSRVNLGKDERKSVEIWPQFVGVTDPLCAKHAKDFYSLINYNPIIRTITAAENLKVSENQWTALVRSIRNVQALFVERLGVGDIEDLAYQFNQRGGLAVASNKESEGYNSGPTAGYCIPKDLLFKLFVVTHQDSRKLALLGIPPHLHNIIIKLMIEIASKQSQFSTSGEWEKWASKQFLCDQQNSLLDRIATSNPQASKEVVQYIQQYISNTGGIIMLHVSKLVRILGSTGVPSPLIDINKSNSKDLHSSLWSSWAERKITLGGEQVNRSVVFPMTREIPQSGVLAKKLNPKADLPTPERLRVHMFGVYKGDDDQKPPPDVRFAWVMRAFLILSGHYKEVALSLDEEGQLISRLGWIGFLPHSKDPEDVKVRQYLALQFINQPDFDLAQHKELIDRLVEKFPSHSTVGDITITAVPGVDSEDLLGFSAETLTLLGDEATLAASILKNKGISMDQMKANAQLHRQFIEEWIPLSNLPPAEQEALRKEIGGRIHPLTLRLRGPGDDFMKDLQGQDVVVFSITHPQLLSLNPAHLRDLMLIGRPNSSLSAHDHVSQGRHRCWFERDVMLWYSACLGIDDHGNRITKWSMRKSSGRKSIYKAFGWGEDHYQPNLGTDLREEVYRQEERAIQVFKYLERICNSDNKQEIADLVTQGDALLFNQKLSQLSPLQLRTEIEILLQYEQRILLANRFKQRDVIIRESLEDVRDHPMLATISPLHWLSIGGYFILNGTPVNYQKRILGIIQKAHMKLNPTVKIDSPSILNESLVYQLIVPSLTTDKIQLADRKGKMFSVKASEEHVETAVTRRKELVIQSKKNQMVKARLEGYHSLNNPNTTNTNLESISTFNMIPIQESISKLSSFLTLDQEIKSGSLEKINKLIGQLLKLCVGALVSIIDFTLDSSTSDEIRLAKDDLCSLVNGQLVNQTTGEVDIKVWDTLVGTYESFGKITPIYEESFKNLPLDQHVLVTQFVSQITSTMLLIEKTGNFLSFERKELTDNLVWRGLAEYFAKTIDDHYSEYTPWTLDPKRYPLFGERYFDSVGILKKECREPQYKLYWSAHRKLYDYIRFVVLVKTSILDELDQVPFDLLFGKTIVSADGSNCEGDQVFVRAIGASAPCKYELLWRSFNQLREITFIKNDGFALPRVFSVIDPYNVHTLDSLNKVNHAFLSPVGRTHYASAMTEGPTLKDNLFITRDGVMVHDDQRSVLTINDAFFWINEQQYIYLLKNISMLTDTQIEKRIASEKDANILLPKGILVASRFSRPVVIGSVVTLHHHHLETSISNAGYPTTDKSPFLYEMTYNKSLYPLIFNPSDETNVNLPQEIDWLQIETTQQPSLDKSKILESIQNRLLPFVQKYPIIIVKGAAESGARNLSRFDLMSGETNTISPVELKNACEFIFHISRSQNVVIQRAIISSPLFWMSEFAIRRLVERQISDYGLAVELNRYPKDSVYGTLRIIMSTSSPNSTASSDLDKPSNWDASHPISLNSLQIATNVGRQGSLDCLTPDMIKEELKDSFILGLQEAGRNVMSAMSKFGPKYWSETIELYDKKFDSFHSRFPHVVEKDATGVPIWWPRYLMLDFIPEPVWINKDTGDIVESSRLLDIVIPPITSSLGAATSKPIYMLKDLSNGVEFEGEIKTIKFWHLEPNVGVGLWTNYWKRELEYIRLESNDKKTIDWNLVGDNDRRVMSNFLLVGKTFLDTVPRALLKKVEAIDILSKENEQQHVLSPIKVYSNGSAVSPANLSLTQLLLDQLIVRSGLQDSDINNPAQFIERGKLFVKEYIKDNNINLDPNDKIANDVFYERIAERYLDSKLSQPLTPFVDILATCSTDTFRKHFAHRLTFAVITGKKTLMNHHFYPFFSSFIQKIGSVYGQSYPLNVVGCHDSWLEYGEGKVYINRCQMLLGPHEDKILEFSIPSDKKVELNACFLLELPNGNEIEYFDHLSSKLISFNVHVMNDSKKSIERCDDKLWIKSKLPELIDSTGLPLLIPDLVLLDSKAILTKQDGLDIIKKQAPSLISKKSNGYIIQPRANTTEAYNVYYENNVNDAIKRLIDINDKDESSAQNNNTTNNKANQYLLSEFIESVKTVVGQKRFIIRMNACVGGQTTLSIVEGSNEKDRVISPGLNGCKWGLVVNILNNLPVPIKKKDWDLWSEIAQSLLDQLDLPLIGIDIILTLSKDTNQYIPCILEANARPGSLIMAEQIHFNKDSGLMESISMCSPISFEFWNQAVENSHLHLNEINQLVSDSWLLFKNRYNFRQYSDKTPLSTQEINVLKDRQQSVTQMINTAINQYGFEKDKAAVLIASNGRYRIFMGHSDLPGLGGFTVNANSIEELLCVTQIIADDKQPGRVILSNENTSFFPTTSFDIQDDIIYKLLHYSSANKEPLWSSRNWENFFKCSLAYLLYKKDEFSNAPITHDLSSLKSKGLSIHCHISNQGLLGLSFKGGLSSSSALTGAFSMSLNSLFKWNLSLGQMARIDYGEYFLGKSGGASDRTAQLFSKKSKICVIGSIPEVLLKTLKFPSDIVVLMAESEIPRFTSEKGKEWITTKLNQGYIKNNTTEEIIQWSHNILKSFGSAVIIQAIEIIKNQFTNHPQDSITQTGLSKIEIDKILICLNKNGLLRDLSVDGEIENQFPEFKNNRFLRYLLIYKLLLILPEKQVDNSGMITFWYRKSVLYALSELERGYVYLNLISNINQCNEREDQLKKDKLILALMKIVKSAHDGDKQIQDYRDGFKPTSWSSDPLNDQSNDIIKNNIRDLNSWLQKSTSTNNTLLLSSSTSTTSSNNNTNTISSNNTNNTSFTNSFDQSLSESFINYFEIANNNLKENKILDNCKPYEFELSLKAGGFQRSLPEFDQLSDDLYKEFNHMAAMRVSAAGLGGSVCIHVTKSVVNDVIEWMSNRNFKICKISWPGAPSQTLFQ